MSADVTLQPQSLQDLFSEIWRAKISLLFWIAIMVCLALVFGKTAKPYFKAEMIVAPANPINGAEVSSLLADENLFALRYLVQRVGVGSSSDFTRFENMYAGPSVASLLLQDENIRIGLARDHAFSFMQDTEGWNAAKLSDYIAKRVRFETIGATPLRRMVYFHPDKEFGIYFLTRIHTLTDTIIRQNIRAEAIERVQYLQEAVEATNNPEHRRALTTLLLEQERLRMLVSIDQPYAASVIEPASSSNKPKWPDWKLLIAGAVLFGAFLGWMFYGLRRRSD